MTNNYIDTSDAAYEALMFLVDVCGAEDVLNEFFDYMNVDMQIEFVHDFIKYHDVDMSEMDDEFIESLNEHYRLHC